MGITFRIFMWGYFVPKTKLVQSSKFNPHSKANTQLLFWNRSRKSIKDFEGIPQPNFEDIKHLDNRIIREELNYNVETLKKEFEKSNSLLNSKQCQVLDSRCILHIWPWGIWKTFLYQTIAAKLRSERKIVLTVASSGQPHLFYYLYLITKGGKAILKYTVHYLPVLKTLCN